MGAGVGSRGEGKEGLVPLKRACAADALHWQSRQPAQPFKLTYCMHCFSLLQTTQLYEMVVVRHGLMLVGQPFSGKTSSLQVGGGKHGGPSKFSPALAAACARPSRFCTGAVTSPKKWCCCARPLPQVLAAALTELSEAGIPGPLFSRVQIRTINPKSVTMGQLYGAWAASLASRQPFWGAHPTHPPAGAKDPNRHAHSSLGRAR